MMPNPNPQVKPKIVVADDDLDLCELLEMKLRQSDYEVFTAMDGVQALELIRSVRPNLVILDIMMPLMTGMEVLRRAKIEHSIILNRLSGQIDTGLGALRVSG